MPTSSGYPNMIDIATRNGSDGTVGLIDETTRAHPETIHISAREIKGRLYKTLVRVGLPTVGFRSPNAGAPISKGRYVDRAVETFYLNPQWECDKAIADDSEDGAQAYIATEASGIVEASMQTLSRVIYYGRNQWTPTSGPGNGVLQGGDPVGFPGLIDMFDQTDLEYDAGGTTAYTASSVWGIKTGMKNCTLVFGNNGELTMSDVILARATDTNSNPLTVYRQELLARVGLQLGDRRAVCRIRNLTADSGHTLTDAMLYDVMSQMVNNIKPDFWLMSRRSLTQLRNSRTAVNPTGQPAPVPTDLDGTPIFVTDSISNYEPINFETSQPE